MPKSKLVLPAAAVAAAAAIMLLIRGTAGPEAGQRPAGQAGSHQAQSAQTPAGASAAAAEPGLFPIKAPMLPDPTSQDILIIAQTLGFMGREGIAIDFVGAIPSTQTLAAIVGGQINVSHGGHVNRSIAAIANGAKIIGVVGKTESSKEIPHMVGVVQKGSGIETPQDLVGKIVGIPGIGGCNEYTPYAWLDKFGISDPKNRIDVRVIPEKNLEQALRQGEIDLAMLHRTPDRINKAGEFDILFSDYDVWGRDGGGTPFMMATGFVAANPDKIRGFVSAIADTLNWANEHPAESLEITARARDIDVNRLSPFWFVKNGVMEDATVEVWNELLVGFGEIDRPLAPGEVFTNEFNKYHAAP